MSATVDAPPPGTKKSEFNDGRIQPVYPWSDSFKDWVKNIANSKYSDELVEKRLLSVLPFYPETDGKRKAEVINTPIGNGNYIHEFYIENTETPAVQNDVKDVVLVHGYAASLGLFIDNFEDLSSIPGIKIHAIDLLGFGFSARPNFPNLPSDTEAEVHKVEDWFIDSIETWRKSRKLDKFILLGHSFGGYLSCAYALKYNKNLIDAATGKNLNPVDKLVLISPVGLDRWRGSILGKGKIPEHISSSDTSSSSDATAFTKGPEPEKEITQNQENVVNSSNSLNPQTSPDISIDSKTMSEPMVPKTRIQKTITYLWKNNYSPFSIVRNLGPMKSKAISRWTTHRFAHVYYTDPNKFYAMHDYIYRIFNAKGSGEFAITRVLGEGALPKLPLLDRCPDKFAKMNLPTLWMYGDKDWMNEKAGYEMTKEINRAAGKKLASFAILPNAGHHLYLDNPKIFSKTVFAFLNFKK